MVIPQRLQTLFWIVFFVFPFATGAFHYRWGPNEHYDADKHELLATWPVCRDNGECADRPEAWRDRNTGEVFSRPDFQGHRTVQAMIFAVLVFGYGLIGCAAAAYFKHAGDREEFFEIFKTFALFDAAFTFLAFLSACAT